MDRERLLMESNNLKIQEEHSFTYSTKPMRRRNIIRIFIFSGIPIIFLIALVLFSRNSSIITSANEVIYSRDRRTFAASNCYNSEKLKDSSTQNLCDFKKAVDKRKYKKDNDRNNNISSPDRLQHDVRHMSSKIYLTNHNLELAKWIQQKWIAAGIENAEIVKAQVYLNEPIDVSVFLETPKYRHQISSVEPNYEEDLAQFDTSMNIPYHSYSKNGTVSGQLVYAFRGSTDDFERLKQAGIDLNGKIALVDQNALYRGVKVENAAKYGLAGILMYDDPNSDQEFTEANGYKMWPYGPARSEFAIQSGNVGSLFAGAKDSISPKSSQMLQKEGEEIVAPIPSVPISNRAAKYLLDIITDQGKMFDDWQGKIMDVKYWTGPSKTDEIITIKNHQDYKILPLYNVVGSIDGELKDEGAIVIGNHHDAWSPGATDPHSASAALNEIALEFGQMNKKGIKPLRKIVFASWDGEEQGLAGSTAWVSQNMEWLRQNAIAHVNIDMFRNGEISLLGQPIFSQVITNSLKLIKSPHTNYTTLFDEVTAGQNVNRLVLQPVGSGSDHAPFMFHAGVSSIASATMPFTKKPTAPYHYHSTYDSVTWFERFGDPGYGYVKAASDLFFALTYKLAFEPILPYYLSDLAQDLLIGVNKLQNNHHIDMKQIKSIVDAIIHAFEKVDSCIERMRNQINSWEDLTVENQFKLLERVSQVNSVIGNLDKLLLLKDGLPNKTYMKHAIYSPDPLSGYTSVRFLQLIESAQNGQTDIFEQQKTLLLECLRKLKDVVIMKVLYPSCII